MDHFWWTGLYWIQEEQISPMDISNFSSSKKVKQLLCLLKILLCLLCYTLCKNLTDSMPTFQTSWRIKCLMNVSCPFNFWSKIYSESHSNCLAFSCFHTTSRIIKIMLLLRPQNCWADTFKKYSRCKLWRS